MSSLQYPSHDSTAMGTIALPRLSWASDSRWDQPTPGGALPWALQVSNLGSPPCKGQAKILVRDLSRSNRVSLSCMTYF